MLRLKLTCEQTLNLSPQSALAALELHVSDLICSIAIRQPPARQIISSYSSEYLASNIPAQWRAPAFYFSCGCCVNGRLAEKYILTMA